MEFPKPIEDMRAAVKRNRQLGRACKAAEQAEVKRRLLEKGFPEDFIDCYSAGGKIALDKVYRSGNGASVHKI